MSHDAVEAQLRFVFVDFDDLTARLGISLGSDFTASFDYDDWSLTLAFADPNNVMLFKLSAVVYSGWML